MIEIHQMLHGYKLGHNYIQGSLLLPSTRDMDKIATLSDWSEFVEKSGERDYITVYPLEESPYYVVAKSWYAEEMHRPGCVWTHSLLLRRDDIWKISDFRQSLSLFCRPAKEATDFTGYSQPLAMNEGATFVESQGYSSISEAKIAEIYADMVSPQPVSIFKEADNTELQELLLNLLNYLPSALLWQTSFCSGTAVPRSYDGKLLSLQFVTHEGPNVGFLSNRTRYYGAQLVAASILNEQRQLSELIRHFEVELEADVQRLRGFLEVIVLANRVCRDAEEKQQVLLSILKQLSESFPQPSDGDSIKQSVLQPSLARDLGGEVNFLYTVSTIDVSSFTEEQMVYKQRLHDLSTEQFLMLLKRLYSSECLNEWGMQTVESIEEYVSYAEISYLRRSDKILFQTMISSNSVLLNQIVWSDFSREEIESTLSVFSDREIVDSFMDWSELFRALLEMHVPIAKELARMILSHDKTCVKVYLNYINKDGNYPQTAMSKELERYPESVLTWLAEETYITQEVVCVLANAIDETSPLVKARGSRIWMPFANALKEGDPIQYNVFLYILSFNWQDREALSYMRQAFYPIHALLEQDRLDYNLWYRLEPYAEHGFFISFWDRCKKMRKMVIKRLKEAGLSKSVVFNYTPDAKTNEWLVGDW